MMLLLKIIKSFSTTSIINHEYNTKGSEIHQP
jgi:hypothetical protein